MSDGPLLELVQVRKAFDAPAGPVEVLHGIDLAIHAGEVVALIGPSGSGKSTLLNLLGLLDRPTSGTLRLLGEDTGGLSEAAITARRARTLGFVFQFHHLLPALTTLENVALPAAALDGRLHAGQRERALALLTHVGLAAEADRPAGKLSGGMQQRVAIARALMNQPPLVFADEPTGNLDTANSDKVMQLLLDWSSEHGTTFVIVTHDPGIAARCRRVLRMVDGQLVADGPPGDVLEG